MNYIDTTLKIIQLVKEGWEIDKNEGKKMYAFHPEKGSEIFYDEAEFYKWLNS
ncbi:MAG: hypothetical protein ACQEV7_16360 [Bacillota bacterium]